MTMSAQDRFSLRNIYLYLVCLITLIISIFAMVNLVRSTVELVYPDPSVHSFPEKAPGMSPEDQERQEEAMAESNQRWAVISVVGSGTTLLISGPIYAYHWRRIQKELPAPPATPAAAA